MCRTPRQWGSPAEPSRAFFHPLLERYGWIAWHCVALYYPHSRRVMPFLFLALSPHLLPPLLFPSDIRPTPALSLQTSLTILPTTQKWWLSRIKHPLIQSIHGSTSQAKQFVDAVQACEEGRRSGGAKMSRRRQETEADEDELIWIQWQELVGLVEAAREEEVGKRAS